jgi:CBS domain-containing protein
MPTRYRHLERRIAEEQQTLARPLRSLVRGAAVVCDAALPIAQAAALMRAKRVGSVVVVDAAGHPIGIVTSHDLVSALAEDAGSRGVGERMSRVPFSLPAHALAYEAALAMVARRIRHVLVLEGTQLIGVVSERDLFSLQRLGVGEITQEIRLADQIPVLAQIAAEIRSLTRQLVKSGVAAEQLMALVSVLNDGLSHRAIDLVRQRHDLERISWCWLAFGSEGRLEQTFSSDQDNGLLFTAHDGASPAQVRARVLPFAREVNEALSACGFPLCKGNVMASNPELCLSAQEWRAKIAGWIESTQPKALLDAAICFDFRPIYGDDSLSSALRDWVHELTRAHPVFLRHMAQNALEVSPALGRLAGFAAEDSGSGRATVDLKLRGARIFVDVARVFALAHAIARTGTVERLRAAQGALGMGSAEIEAATDAFFVIQTARLRRQAQGPDDEPAAQNRIDPAQLSRFEALTLKEALRVARELQERLALDYQL